MCVCVCVCVCVLRPCLHRICLVIVMGQCWCTLPLSFPAQPLAFLTPAFPCPYPLPHRPAEGGKEGTARLFCLVSPNTLFKTILFS